MERPAVNVFLGVDGGGTKTEFLVVDERGQVLARRLEGSAYYPEVGLEALKAMLTHGIRTALAAAAIPAAQIAYTCIGLPAYGEDSALTPRLDEIVADILPPQRCRCVNDMVCGWAAALGGRDGINIIAGTGSIGYGEFAGRQARAGGWGEVFSDEGSAYWVARECLNLFSRMSDRRAPRGALYELVRAHFNLSVDLDLCAAVYGPPPMPRSTLAALAPLAARAAVAGDDAARRIFQTAATELAAIVHAVREQLAVPAQLPVAVCYSGGMFQRDDLLTHMLQTALQASEARYELCAPQLTPHAGAVLYAAKLAGAPFTPEALAHLGRTHGAGP